MSGSSNLQLNIIFIFKPGSYSDLTYATDPMPCEIKQTLKKKKALLSYISLLSSLDVQSGSCLRKAEKMFWLRRKGSQSLLGILGQCVIDGWVRSQESYCPGLNKRVPFFRELEKDGGDSVEGCHQFQRKGTLWERKQTFGQRRQPYYTH